jgi:cell division protein FtsB
MTTGRLTPILTRATRISTRCGATLYRMRRKLATAGVALLALMLAFHVIFGQNGMVVYQKKKAEYRGLEKEVIQLQQDNKLLSDQIKALKTDPKAIEREAREQLRYARPGEVVYLMPGQKAPEAPPPNASARKR